MGIENPPLTQIVLPTDPGFASTHCLYRFLDGKKLAASNLAFQTFEGFIGT
jgi:hypothetical protein